MNKYAWIRKQIPLIWAEENALAFNNRLPKPRFFLGHKITRKNGWAAYWDICKDGKHRITLDPAEIPSVKDLRRVMLHEMTHMLQWLAKSKRTKNEMHGRFFKRHALRILATRNIWIELE